jgi:hypothetical protein
MGPALRGSQTRLGGPRAGRERVVHRPLPELATARTGPVPTVTCTRAAQSRSSGAGSFFSHWVLDVVTHRPFVPLFHRSDTYVGLGLWNSLAGTLLVELALFAGGVALYAVSTRARDRQGIASRFGASNERVAIRPAGATTSSIATTPSTNKESRNIARRPRILSAGSAGGRMES